MERRIRLIVAVTIWAYAFMTVLSWLALRFLGDRWWLATLFLYGPRWIIAVPLGVLVPAAIIWHRRLLLVLLLVALIICVPVMGFVIPFHKSSAKATSPRDIRICTYNMGGGIHNVAGRLKLLLTEVQPDVVALQEATITDQTLKEIPEWHYYKGTSVGILSRLPVRRMESRDPRNIWKQGGCEAITHFELEHSGQVIHFVNLQLETPREGIQEVILGKWKGIPLLRSNTVWRAYESEVARNWVNQIPGSPLIAGDFNMPVESAIYRKYWSDFTDAFSATGSGYGATKWTRWFGIRIDHILAGPGWECQRSWVEPQFDGDHRPLVADFKWVGAR